MRLAGKKWLTHLLATNCAGITKWNFFRKKRFSFSAVTIVAESAATSTLSRCVETHFRRHKLKKDVRNWKRILQMTCFKTWRKHHVTHYLVCNVSLFPFLNIVTWYHVTSRGMYKDEFLKKKQWNVTLRIRSNILCS